MKLRKTLITLFATTALAACTGDNGKNGQDGDAGMNGKDGVDGTNGADGTNGTNGKDGTNGTNGLKGTDGYNGPSGEDGMDGQDGADGLKGTDGFNGPSGKDGKDGQDGMDLVGAPRLIRLVTTPLGSEVTGLFKTDNGELFFNVQHPSDTLPGDEPKASVGAWTGADADAFDPHMTPVAVPDPASAAAESAQVAVGSYQVLGRASNTVGGITLGEILAADGTTSIKQSNDPDFNAFIPSSADGSTGYLFTAWEDRPGALSRLELTKESDGTWTVGAGINVDFSSVNGTMINCFGSVTPWGTPMTSEENYEAENAQHWNDANYADGYPNYADVQNIQTYLGGTYPNPYDYGYIVEITDPTGTPTPVKHFVLGRLAHENAVVMPDRKTVYTTSDGSEQSFYKFVADAAGDLSAGTLYAAKLSQDATSDPSKAGFDITWIELAHGDDSTIAGWIADYDGFDETDYVDNSTNYIDDSEVSTWAGGGAADDRVAFLETARAARAKGATAEFTKMEGISINHDGVASGAVPFMYVAMSDVKETMADTAGDIQLQANRCGVVYRFGLTATYDVLRMEPAVSGGPYDSASTTNKCDLENISSPDNVLVLDDGRVIIGEDTGNHINNMIWLYNPQGQ